MNVCLCVYVYIHVCVCTCTYVFLRLGLMCMIIFELEPLIDLVPVISAGLTVHPPSPGLGL